MTYSLTELSRGACVLGVALLLASTATACGDDDDGAAPSGGDGKGSGTADAGGAGSGGSASSDDACERGCELTLEADCAMGPGTQAQCETDCKGLRNGACGDRYRAYMECGKGEDVTCDGRGLPVIAACSDERDAVIDCLQ